MGLKGWKGRKAGSVLGVHCSLSRRQLYCWNPAPDVTFLTMQLGDAIQLPEFESALARSVKALRGLAEYELEPNLQRRMQDLGERKEFLSATEHEELMSLVEFSEHRTLERLEAEVALKQLGEFVPQLLAAS